jgi:FkbM family methyltransferase
VGANVGIYTLLACIKAGPTGKVYAFEPMERNLRYLRRHITLNHLLNCHIVEAAVSDTDGTQRFSSASWHDSMGRISSDGELEVRSVTLDSYFYGEPGLPPPTVIKIDVEGAEMLVLKGANRIFSEFHPQLFIEIHGNQQHADCRAYLIAKGYRLEEAYGRIRAS